MSRVEDDGSDIRVLRAIWMLQNLKTTQREKHTSGFQQGTRQQKPSLSVLQRFSLASNH